MIQKLGTCSVFEVLYMQFSIMCKVSLLSRVVPDMLTPTAVEAAGAAAHTMQRAHLSCNPPR